MIADRLKQLHPGKLLDIGCRRGEFTITINDFCKAVTSIDIDPEYIQAAIRENSRPNITYQIGDACALDFVSGSFDAVLMRNILHHIYKWPIAIQEALRVCSGSILIEEPVLDLTTEGRINLNKAMLFELELFNEIGYPHSRFLFKDDILTCLNNTKRKFTIEDILIDEELGFDDFFGEFETFAAKSNRRDYWMDRLEKFRREMSGKTMRKCDKVFIEIS